MVMHLDFEIANFKKIMKAKQPWEAGDRLDTESQSLLPRDPELHRKFGLKQGSRVLFILGGAGDWANALADRGIEVHYTDASKSVTEFVKKRFPQTKIKSFTVRDALRWPEKTGYDRIVSYEPMPLDGLSLPFVLLRAVGHSKGATLVYRSVFSDVEWEAIAKKLSSLYGIRHKTEEKTVFGLSHPAGESADHPIVSFHVDSPRGKGRRLAQIDLAVLAALAYKKEFALKDIAKRPALAKFRLTEPELLNSLKRLSQLSEHVWPGLKQTVTVKTRGYYKKFSPHGV